jgi:hypothetical protein
VKRRLHLHLGWRCAFVYLEPRDIWVGVYVAEDWVYVCPLPFVVIKVMRAEVTR